MSRSVPFSRPVVVNFSGNDSAGLAGVAMDIRTQTALGIHSATIVTANTAQNNTTVLSVNPVTQTVFSDQLQANATLPVRAIKVGLIADRYQIDAIRRYATDQSVPMVFDPVLKSSSGKHFSDGNTFIADLVETLLPVCTLLTPNREEAEHLSGISIRSVDDVVAAANKILAMGVGAVLIKGGHLSSLNEGDIFAPVEGDSSRLVQGDSSPLVQGDSSPLVQGDSSPLVQDCSPPLVQDCSSPLVQDCSSPLVQDYFTDGKKAFWLASERVVTENLRGTGCALSSAITSALALGYGIYDAVVIGKMAIAQGIRNAYALACEQGGAQPGPVNISHFPNEQIDLPVLSEHPVNHRHRYPVSPCCNQPLLGLYPVIDRAEWIQRLASTGVTTMQLRIKDLTGAALEGEIQQAVAYAQQHNIRLFINDYWQLAIRYQAYGVHLGQEDLDASDIDCIKAAGLRLGLSTHCHYEVARAHGYRPSYIACGPVYHTTTKQMPWVPHGIEGLSYWRRVLAYPLVAIGGINTQRFADVAKTGVDSIAMITAITLADDPFATTRQFLTLLHLTLLQCQPNEQ